MAIDKAISYRQQAAFGGIMGRDGRRMYGGGSDMGSVADSQGNVGPGTGGYQGGPLGGYGDAGSSNNPSGDRYRESRQEYQQAVNTAAAIEAAKIEAAKKAKEKEKRDKRDAKNKNITKFGYAKPKSKVGGILGTIAGMMLGIPGLGLLTGGFDKLKGGLGSLNETLGDFREKTTGFRTQAEYDAARQQRQLQGRLDNMYDRKSKGKNFSQKNMDMLEAMGLQPSTAQNVLTGRDLKGFTDSRMGLQTPQTFSDPQGIAFNNPVGGLDQYATEMEALEAAKAGEILKANQLGGTLQDFYTNKQPLASNQSLQVIDDNINFNTQPQGINTIDVGYPSNDLMAGLTEMQQKMLAGPQKNLKNIMGISDQEILNNISPFNDPEDPATLEEVQTFYGADGGLASMFTRRG
jgi:hypothetical protein